MSVVTLRWHPRVGRATRVVALASTAVVASGLCLAGTAQATPARHARAAVIAPSFSVARRSPAVAHESLAGEWRSKTNGSVYDFVKSGARSYSGLVVDGGCASVPGDIKDTAHGNGNYTGTENVFSSFDPCTVSGTATNTIQISSDGRMAQWDSAGCSDCGPQTWIRVASPYRFILPRSLKNPSAWRKALTARHHDHPAIDIAVSVGTPYFAITAGIVTHTKAAGNCGKGIVLQGTDGVQYEYCHGSKWIVASGTFVDAGQELGLTGNTGASHGAHLHFQITFPLVPKTLRCPQTLLLALYDNTKPRPDAHTVHTLPTSGCVYVKKK